VEERGPVRDKTHANIMLGARLGSFQISLQFCWPSPKGVLSTWYMYCFRDGTADLKCESETLHIWTNTVE